MKMLKLLLKLSSEYWNKHRQRFLSFAFLVMAGSAALCSVALLIRSEKSAILEEELVLLGNYDAIIYETNQAVYEQLLQENDNTGCYYELGYVEAGEEPSPYKAAAYDNSVSEDLYHMTCVRGNYPENAGEIAIDLSIAKRMGIAPYPGEEITLQLYDTEKQMLAEKTYVVSGIFDAMSEEAYGGWKRYVYQLETYNESYDLPGVFFSKADMQVFQPEQVTVFTQVDEAEERELVEKILNMQLDPSLKSEYIVCNGGRRYAYTYILGLVEYVQSNYEGMNGISVLMQAIRDGAVIKDFYSAILVPVFSALICVIVFMSIYSFVRMVMQDRLSQVGILRSLGMKARDCSIWLLAEILVLASLFSGLGIVLGGGLHAGVIAIVNARFHLALELGFQVSKYVAGATVNPYLFSIVVIMTGVALATILVLIRIYKSDPIRLLFQLMPEGKTAKVKKRGKSGETWIRLLNRRLVLHDTITMVTMMLLMGAALFGFTYFSALADKENAVYREQIENVQLGEYQYVARMTGSKSYFQIENHHNYGLTSQKLQELQQNEAIEEINAQIINRSARLAYAEGENLKDIDALLQDMKIRQYAPSENEYDEALYEAEIATLEGTGYSSGEELYVVPMNGLQEEKLKELENNVIAGQINADKIRSGQEVILAVPEEQAELVQQVFDVGEALPLSDVVLDRQGDDFNLSGSVPDLLSSPVYEKEVEDPSGSLVPVKAYVFGARKDINTRVGAIVVLHSETDYEQYLISKEETTMGADMYRSSDYGFTILCMDQSYAAWGLPDQNYNRVQVKVKKNADLQLVDPQIYSILASGKGMEIVSTAEIQEKEIWKKQKVMVVFFIMVLMLVLVAACAIAFSLYMRIRISTPKLVTLRCLGMTEKQLMRMLVTQNIYYPVVGVIFAILPVAMCQGWFYYLRHLVESGAADNWSFNQDMRLMEIPYWYNLFDYNFGMALIVILLLGVLLIILGTIPQVRYIKKLNLIQEIERNTY